MHYSPLLSTTYVKRRLTSLRSAARYRNVKLNDIQRGEMKPSILPALSHLPGVFHVELFNCKLRLLNALLRWICLGCLVLTAVSQDPRLSLSTKSVFEGFIVKSLAGAVYPCTCPILNSHHLLNLILLCSCFWQLGLS